MKFWWEYWKKYTVVAWQTKRKEYRIFLLAISAVAVFLLILFISAVLDECDSGNKVRRTEERTPDGGIGHSANEYGLPCASERPLQCSTPFAQTPCTSIDAPYMPSGEYPVLDSGRNSYPFRDPFEQIDMMERYARAAAVVERRNWEDDDRFRKMQERIWSMTPEQLQWYRQKQAGEREQLEIDAKDRALMQEMGEHERAWAAGQTRDEMLKARELGTSRIGDTYSDVYQTPSGDLYRIAPDGSTIYLGNIQK